MGDIVIDVRNVSLGYSRKRRLISRTSKTWALRDVSFSVRAGETIGIVGRNGAGKSTLLRILAGIMRPDSGTVTRAELRASLLSLQVGFLGHLSGHENAVLSGMLLGLSKAEVKAKLHEIVEFAELQDFIDEPLASYSSGMRSRLGFSVAYYAAPELLLIDEVFGVGDIGFREKSASAIRDLIRSNRTVVMVSHQASTLVELCDRIVWIEEGVTRLVGTPNDVLPRYKSFALAPRDTESRTRLVSAG